MKYFDHPSPLNELGRFRRSPAYDASAVAGSTVPDRSSSDSRRKGSSTSAIVTRPQIAVRVEVLRLVFPICSHVLHEGIHFSFGETETDKSLAQFGARSLRGDPTGARLRGDLTVARPRIRVVRRIQGAWVESARRKDGECGKNVGGVADAVLPVGEEEEVPKHAKYGCHRPPFESRVVAPRFPTCPTKVSRADGLDRTSLNRSRPSR